MVYFSRAGGWICNKVIPVECVCEEGNQEVEHEDG